MRGFRMRVGTSYCREQANEREMSSQNSELEFGCSTILLGMTIRQTTENNKREDGKKKEKRKKKKRCILPRKMSFSEYVVHEKTGTARIPRHRKSRAPNSQQRQARNKPKGPRAALKPWRKQFQNCSAMRNHRTPSNA